MTLRKLTICAPGHPQIPRPVSEGSQGRVSRKVNLPLHETNPRSDSSIDMWYLHGPDRSVPYEDTLRAVNECYKEGKFKRFGISNYQSYVLLPISILVLLLIMLQSWEVAEMVGICKANGWIQPTVYQGIYNAIHRYVPSQI